MLRVNMKRGRYAISLGQPERAGAPHFPDGCLSVQVIRHSPGTGNGDLQEKKRGNNPVIDQVGRPRRGRHLAALSG